MVVVPRLPRVHPPRARRWHWLLAGAVLVAGLASLRSPYRPDEPCPSGSQTVTPMSVRLVPSVVRHQSWVGVRSADVHFGMKLFACTDGRLVGETRVDDGDLALPLTTIGIPTNWVASMWLAGRLDEYRAPDRWVILVGELTEYE